MKREYKFTESLHKTWDKELALTADTSEYYAVMVQKFGKAMADYYWNKRHSYEREYDLEWRSVCKDINEKCDEFLKSRGINPFQY